jgi:non-homologous end joining protein Ku
MATSKRQKGNGMAGSAAWRGAIEFNGFPINIALWPKVKSSRGESFRTLAPDGQPVKQVYLDSSGEQVATAECSKGVETEKGVFKTLSPEAVERIQEGEKSSVLNAAYFAPLSTVPVELATASYHVRADEKVAGAASSANVLWNGLRAHGLAYVTQATLRAGSPDVVLAVWADEKGLVAGAFPFEQQLWAAPEGEFTENAAAADLFGQFVNTGGDQAFSLGDFTSEYSARRKAVVDAELAGETVQAPEPAATEAVVPDLMAALKASVDAKKKPAKKQAAKVPVPA